jgi:hypothetical protein
VVLLLAVELSDVDEAELSPELCPVLDELELLLEMLRVLEEEEEELTVTDVELPIAVVVDEELLLAEEEEEKTELVVADVPDVARSHLGQQDPDQTPRRLTNPVTETSCPSSSSLNSRGSPEEPSAATEETPRKLIAGEKPADEKTAKNILTHSTCRLCCPSLLQVVQAGLDLLLGRPGLAEGGRRHLAGHAAGPEQADKECVGGHREGLASD